MRPRAVIIGLVLAVLLATFGWANDYLLAQARVADHLIPLSVFGLLVMCMLVVNPLLRWLPGQRLDGRDWSVVIGMLLVAAMMPSPGLLWHFTPLVSLPHRYQAANPGWQERDLLSYAPACMLVDIDPDGDGVPDDRIVYGLQQGLRPGERVGVSGVPWGAWDKTLGFWLPLLGLGFTASVCMALVLHPQWAHRERLRYPVAELASELIHGAGERAWPAIFYRREFWFGFVPVMAILLFNGVARWTQMPFSVPLLFDFTAVLQKWPFLNIAPDLALWVLKPRINFIVLGFAFLVSTDVSFSMGISPILFAAVFLLLHSFGLNPRASNVGGLSQNIESFQKMGSYLGLAAIIVYTGRYYYGSVLSRALGVRVGDPVSPAVLWAFRLAVLAAAGMVGVLTAVGLAWPLAVGVVLLSGVIMLCLTRMNAETGMYSFHVWWHAGGFLQAMLGSAALGPHMFAIMAILAAQSTWDPRVKMMPLVANALKIGENGGVRPTRFTWGLLPTVLLCLLLGVLGAIILQYNFGTVSLGWSTAVARAPWDAMMGAWRDFENRPPGAAGVAWSLAEVNRTFLVVGGIGFGLVVVTSALRLRFSWWPLHPVLFLLWGTWPMQVMAGSWMMGWFLKFMMIRVGGGSAFTRFKPMFIGLMAGDFASRILLAVWGMIYYAVTGTHGPVMFDF